MGGLEGKRGGGGGGRVSLLERNLCGKSFFTILFTRRSCLRATSLVAQWNFDRVLVLVYIAYRNFSRELGGFGFREGSREGGDGEE